jgi:regulator of sirC expression with transglutaminase-like and TPR domain
MGLMLFNNLVRALLCVSAVVCFSNTPVLAEGTSGPSTSDRLELVGLGSQQPSPDAPSTAVRFQATVNYHLQSAPSGLVLLFLFENSANDSSQQSSDPIPVQRGSGQLILNIDYTLRPDVRTLTLVAALFRDEQHLVAWVSTNPIDMVPWPGRVAFEKAMAARLGSDFNAAEQQLSQAIQSSPETANYYYWRGDTRVRLNDFSGAVADFDRSLQLMPQDRPSYVGRGIAELWLGQPELAITDLSTAIDSASTPDTISAWAYRARGLARASLGQSESAITDYHAYLSLSPAATDRQQIEGWIADLS